MSHANSASQAQVTAANPTTSTWLSANAGSGKTRVLTERVARLLLNGTPPQRILCLTYTKAAASEMQNRLFSTLGEWAMLDDGELERALGTLGIPASQNTDETRNAARTLFARAIETPGGLKIQTIHSFCSALLRRFPLEAGVSPGFTELDETGAKALQQQVLDDLANHPDGADAIARLAYLLSDASMDGFLAGVLSARGDLDLSADRAAICDWLGVAPALTSDQLVADILSSDTQDLLSHLVQVLAAGSKNDVKAADALAPLAQRPPHAGGLSLLEKTFLFGAGAKAPFGSKRGKFPTNATRDALGPTFCEVLDDLMDTVAEGREVRLALQAADRTATVMDFARAFLPTYDAAKMAQGVLDFDDLIRKSRALLTQPGVAQWVLFRLDGGLDHILVDEAQDTSPAQWDVIRLLAQEFTAGSGARADVQRTIFVVGDQKQSIYSFQGADPAGFERMRHHFQSALSQVGQPFQNSALEYSFRSSPAILRAVDATFAGDSSRGLLAPPNHLAFFADMPGRVDLWPAEPDTEAEDDPDWRLPVDLPAKTDPRLVLARRVADQMQAILDSGTQITNAKGQTRPVRPGDFLILVQRRSEIFHEVIRACKERGIPVAGADRLRVGAELAVRDLIALLSFLSTPEDDLSLAIALRSPLLGWDERGLYTLAQGRPGFLWERLRGQADQHPETLALLHDLLDQVDFLRPYDLLERILIRHDGRKRLLARLGTEAEDGVDALLAQALAYEDQDTPSLTGFLTWFQEDELTIKRQLDDASDQVRVMTVHGSKGLESPIVILPDTAKLKAPKLGNTLTTPDGLLAWLAPADENPASLQELRTDRLTRLEEERMRLLYVAMTRAESWLMVAAAKDTGGPGDSWYEDIRAGLIACGATETEMPGGKGLRFGMGTWPDPVMAANTDADASAAALPGWSQTPAPAAPDRAKPLSPSDLGGPKSLGGGGEDATLDGDRMHLLLEHLPDLPRPDWTAKAQALLTGPLALDDADLAALVSRVDGIVTTPALAPVFAPSTLKEVTVTDDTPLGRLFGTIDRLILPPAPDPILIVDYKTNARVPDSPETVPAGLLRQMGAYAHAIGSIYPDRCVQTALLWTTTGELMPLPAALVEAAFAEIATLDGPQPGS